MYGNDKLLAIAETPSYRDSNQVDCMKNSGNVRSNQIFDHDLAQHPASSDMEGDEGDTALQRYIQKKYRDKAFTKRTEPLRRPVPATKISQKSSLEDLQQTRTVPVTRISGANTPPLQPLSPMTRQSLIAPRANTAPIPQLSRSASPLAYIEGRAPVSQVMTGTARPLQSGGNSSLADPSMQPRNSFVPSHAPLPLPSASALDAQYTNLNAYPPRLPAASREIWSDLASLSLAPRVSAMSLITQPSPSTSFNQPQFSPALQWAGNSNPFLPNATHAASIQSYQLSQYMQEQSLMPVSVTLAGEERNPFRRQTIPSPSVFTNYPKSVPYIPQSSQPSQPSFQPSIASSQYPQQNFYNPFGKRGGF